MNNFYTFQKIFALPITCFKKYSLYQYLPSAKKDERRTDICTRPDSSNTIQPSPLVFPEPTTTASAITAPTSLPVLLLVSCWYLYLSFMMIFNVLGARHRESYKYLTLCSISFLLNQCPILFFPISICLFCLCLYGVEKKFSLLWAGDTQSLWEAPWLTMLFSPHSWYQNSWKNENYPKTQISVYILKTLRLRSRSPLCIFKTTLKYEIIWWYDALDRCEHEV